MEDHSCYSNESIDGDLVQVHYDFRKPSLPIDLYQSDYLIIDKRIQN